MTIRVLDIIGKKIGISTEDGQKLNRAIIQHIQDGESVEVSFEGIDIVISHFLNEGIGKLYKTFPKTEWNKLNHRLTYTGLSGGDEELLVKKVIPISQSHFENENANTTIQDQILE